MKHRIVIIASLLAVVGCVPDLVRREPTTSLPDRFVQTADTVTSADVDWRTFYGDTLLAALIDSALRNNKELNIVAQEIAIAGNEVDARGGDYLPFVTLGANAGVEKSGRYTRNGAVEEQLEVRPGERFPEPLPTYTIGASMSWEVDIWRKLRNAQDASSMRLLATIEGTRYLVTQVVSELASSYYELMALDNLLDAIDANNALLRRALLIVEQQKIAAKATELAVRKFDAEVQRNEGRRFDVLQRIVETENRINVLLGRYPQRVPRSSQRFLATNPDTVHAGVPSRLLEHRTDVRRAELEMKAADLDIDVAKAEFYPSLNIMAGFGYQAFNARYIVTSPESMIYNLAGELLMPVINRAAIKAAYFSAGARQVQAAYSYEQTVLTAYVEVANQLSKRENLRNRYERITRQVDALTTSVDIANNLFLSARADYMEVLMTQRDALEAKMELIETKLRQMQAHVDVYRALGGGWK